MDKGIYKEVNGSYTVDKVVNGERIRKRGFSTLFEAKRFIYSLDVNKQKKEVNKITIDDVIFNYFEYKKTKLKMTTFVNRQRIITKWIVNYFKNIDIREVFTYEALSAWKQQLNTGELSNEHINNIIGYMRDILEQYSILNDIDNKVYARAKLALESIHDDGTVVDDNKINFWTLDDFEKFISTFQDDDKYKAFFFTLYYTGMRFGEISGLKWNNVDLEKGVIKIDHQVVRGVNKGTYQITTTKTKGSVREILLTKQNVKILQVLKSNDDDFVFFGSKPISQTQATRVKDEHIKAAEVARISLHDFRHSHASLLINNGADIVLVSKRLGHANISETLNTYTHLFPNKQIEIISKL